MVVGKAHSVKRNHFIRRCVFCGYDGALLRGGHASTCAACGCDLTQRPARSYAEMEGLAQPPMTLETLMVDSRAARIGRTGQRWLSFLFLVVVGFLLLVYLVAAALP